MRRRSWPWLLVGSLALVAALGAPALAQVVPVRVAQGDDGTLYLVQGQQAWILVPDRLGDDELAGLSVAGEVDGTLPAGLLAAPVAPADAPPPSQDVTQAPPSTSIPLQKRTASVPTPGPTSTPGGATRR